mmetsp:Transcript_1776/g.2872  ORF Transcript_1776/g.2872 Transcript_1776/m.2872 type:complete len:232 (+) Transcript_1776:665-1360(+)
MSRGAKQRKSLFFHRRIALRIIDVIKRDIVFRDIEASTICGTRVNVQRGRSQRIKGTDPDIEQSGIKHVVGIGRKRGGDLCVNGVLANLIEFIVGSGCRPTIDIEIHGSNKLHLKELRIALFVSPNQVCGQIHSGRQLCVLHIQPILAVRLQRAADIRQRATFRHKLQRIRSTEINKRVTISARAVRFNHPELRANIVLVVQTAVVWRSVARFCSQSHGEIGHHNVFVAIG